MVKFAIDPNEDFVQMPLHVGKGAQPAYTFSVDFGREHRSKSVPPEAHGLIAYLYTAFAQQVFNIQERERGTEYRASRLDE